MAKPRAPYMSVLLGRAVTNQQPIITRIIPPIVSGQYNYRENERIVFRVTRTAKLLEVWRECRLRYRRPVIVNHQAVLPDWGDNDEYDAIPGRVIHPHSRPATKIEASCYRNLPRRRLPPYVRIRNGQFWVQIGITHPDILSLHRGILEHTVKRILGEEVQIEGGEYLYNPGTLDDVRRVKDQLNSISEALTEIEKGIFPPQAAIAHSLAIASELRRTRTPAKVAARTALESLPKVKIEDLIPTIQKAALALQQNQRELIKQAKALLAYDGLVMYSVERIANGIQEVYQDLAMLEADLERLSHAGTPLTYARLANFAARIEQIFARLILYTPFNPFRERTFSTEVLRLQRIKETALLEGARGILRTVRTARSHLTLYVNTS